MENHFCMYPKKSILQNTGVFFLESKCLKISLFLTLQKYFVGLIRQLPQVNFLKKNHQLHFIY